MTPEDRKVVLASSLGSLLEWYDFYVFVLLAPIVGKQFFAALAPAAQLTAALVTGAASWLLPPLGALVFGRVGDLVGRKPAFLITTAMMGASTLLVGLLPTYSGLGLVWPASLVGLRLLQGLALGGGPGGAAIYVAEQAPHGKRGLYTGWVQGSATGGLLVALLVILVTRACVGEDAFAGGWWRVPFLLSFLLLLLSAWMRLRLAESPAFARIRAAGRSSEAPLLDSLGKRANLKIMLLALLGATAGQAAVWYCGHIYALGFLTRTLKVGALQADLMVAAALAIGAPLFIVVGALSDRIGRLKIIMAGCFVAVVTYFPLFQALTHNANPALEVAQAAAPAFVVADPATCSLLFDPIAATDRASSCDMARAALADSAVPYTIEAAPPDAPTAVRLGARTIWLTDRSARMQDVQFEPALAEAIKAAGYPARADPAAINHWIVILILTIMVMYAAMVYGPIAAMLVELFPTRIRYTSLSLPYHIGNGWFGGFLPATSFAIVAATGNIYSGLWYPIIVAGMTFVIGALFLPETKDRDIYASD